MNQKRTHRATGAKLPANVKLLGAASLLNDIASEMVFPLMPAFLMTVLGGNRIHLGLMEGVADSVSSLLRLWSGAWSDRVRWRKGFVVVGYALAAIARPLAGLAAAPAHLFMARTADRIGKGIRTSPRDALIADSTAPDIRGRAFGFHQAMDHLGAAIGPVLATLFLLVWPGQLRYLFLLTLVPGVLVVGLIVLGLREPRPTAPVAHAELAAERKQSLGLPFRLYLVATLLFALGNSSDAFLLVRAGELGISPAWIPLLWCAFHLVKSGANLFAGKVTDKVGPRPMLMVGWLSYAACYLAFTGAQSAWQMWILFLIYGFVYSLTEPAAKAFVARLVAPDRNGLAFGWFNFAVGIAALPASFVFGVLYEQYGSFTAFGLGASSAIAAAGLLLAIPAVQPERINPIV